MSRMEGFTGHVGDMRVIGVFHCVSFDHAPSRMCVLGTSFPYVHAPSTARPL
jgi:hypothetical protein